MKKEILTKSLFAGALALTIGFCGVTASYAAPGDAPAKMQQRQEKPMQKLTPEEMKAKMEKRAKEFNEALGLSEEQVAKAKEIRINGHAKMKPLMEKKKAKISEIKAVMDNDNLKVKEQDKRVEALRADLKGIDQDIRQLRRDNEKEFEAILTPEQKAKYAQIKEEGRKHFREHHKPMGPEGFCPARGHKPGYKAGLKDGKPGCPVSRPIDRPVQPPVQPVEK